MFPEQTKSALTSANREQIAIPRPIHQAETKQLIQAISPDELLCVWVRPENFEQLGLHFNDFLTVIHGSSEQNLIFYLNKAIEDLVPALQAYYLSYPTVMQAIGVEDPEDFKRLMEKCGTKFGPRCCGKEKSNIDETYALGKDYARFLEMIDALGRNRAQHPWVTLPLELIRAARDHIPEQVGDVECAANSGARALILCNIHNNVCKDKRWEGGGYDSFRNACPQDIKKITKNVAESSCLFGLLLAPVTGGASLAVGNVIGGTAASLSSLASGPSPWELAKYINRHMPTTASAQLKFSHAQVYTYPNFDHCATAIASDIRAQDPVIVFIFWGPKEWHYTNVVGIKESDGNIPDGFMILDTYQDFQYRDYANMRHVMYNAYKFNSSFCLGGTPNDYNIIRFHRK